MLRFRSVSVSSIFLPTVFLVFSTFFFCSTTSREVVTTQYHPFQFKPIQGLFGGEEDWIAGQRRFIAEGSRTDESVNNSSLILAAERTKRRDPLNDFNRYTGGWNISERHYWA
ncbi:Envelope glycoprotein b, partial [Thalictrum thalictroides]